ncbi:unnamed protein product [Chironomus riparius]|uniref:DEUBAD domain-containing protein n=1 Tax=Chironomus riparius TaxID=315576 RepID=A0A9N9RS69_9DIPT|nr:unnamed protein product [Chironomus riparius]
MNSDCLLQDQENISDSESSEATILSSNESFSESVPENCEVAKILDHKLQLPKDLCEDGQIFHELFSTSTWNGLSNEEKEHLTKFLPEFPENSKREQDNTVQLLFSNKIFRFGQTPLDQFHANLQDGNYRPDIAHYRKCILKEEERDQRIRECERISLLAEKMVISREKQLRYAYTSGDTHLNSDDKLSRSKLSASIAAMRGNKRYFQELLKVFDELNYSLSDDETIPNRSHLQLTKKQIKQFSDQDNVESVADFRIVSTTSTKEKNWDHMTESIISNEKYKQMLRNFRKRKNIEPDHAEMEIGEIKLKEIISRSSLLNSRKILIGNSCTISNKKPSTSDSIRIKQETSTKPIINLGIAAKNQIQKPQNKNLCKVDVQEKPLKLGSQSETDEEDWIKANIIKIEPNENSTQSKGNMKLEQKVQKIQQKMKIPYQQQQQLANTNVFNRKRSNIDNVQPRAGKKIIIDAGGIVKPSFITKNMSTIQNNISKKNLVLDTSINTEYEVVEYSPEMTHDTQNCFLSLIRDIFCSTTDHRIKLEELRKRINVWLKNPVALTNIWFKDVEQWGSLLISAVHFLSGEFLDQPQHFVPYLEFKSQMNIYQWIGAGRDSDARMLSLNQYWLSRRNDMGIKASNALKQKPFTKILTNPEKNESNYLLQSISPPNHRCRSTWKVQCPTKSELAEFQTQEQKRYENPYFPFIYYQHGYESVVGPLRDMHLPVSVITKARDNNILIPDRPNYITTVAIVRDAIARLPNGEGTFDAICELVKYSKFLTLNLSENVIRSFVSTALDTISSENHDSSAKFDNKRKLWVYMHRNRSEEEFERIYQQQQGNIKPKKAAYRKINPMENIIRVSTNNSGNGNSTGSATTIKVSKVNTDSEMMQQMPALAAFETKKINQMHSSPPPLKISPKRFIKTVNSDKSIEAFDVEASLDAHTTPIVKASDSKTSRVILKATPQMSQLQTNNLMMGAISAGRSQSTKVTTVLGSKKIIGKPVTIGQNETISIVSQSNLSNNSNYIVTMSPSNGDRLKSSEPPALQATSLQQAKPTMSQKSFVMVSANNEKMSLSQQSQKFIIASSTPQLGNQKGGKVITLPRNQTPMLSQQKQILTNVIVQQQKAKSGQQIMLSANNTQKIPISINSSVQTSSTPTTIIQIQQPSTSITNSNLNSTKSTVFQLRQLKQDGSQQTMILKPQIIKNVGSNSDLPAPPLIVNKILKSTANSVLQGSQIITTTAQKMSTETTNSPIFARVVSSGGRQLIDGIMPKNAGTFKLAGAGGVQQNVLQISGSPQYTVVSKGKTIVSPSTKITTSKSNTTTNLTPTQNILITSHTNNSNQAIMQSSSHVQHQPLKIVQGGTITAQQLLNAKLINVQALGNKGFKPSSGIKMLNSQGYITNLGTKTGGVPIIIAGKSTNQASTNQTGQGIVLQANSSQNNTFILNSNQTTLKMQGNIISQPQQTVVLGNQVLKVQSLNQMQAQKQSTSSAKSNTETVVLATNSGKNQTINNPSSPNQDGKQMSVTNSSGQQIILGSTLKVLKNMISKNNNMSQQTARVVLTPSSGSQGGQFAQQIILPANFQGIKTLKVIQQARLVQNNVGNTSGVADNKTVTLANNQDEGTNE